MTTLYFRLAVFALFTSTLSAGGDWNQWLGPKRNGAAAPGPKLLEVLDEKGELPVLWESDFVPSDKDGGHSSVVVSDGRVYVGLVWHERIPVEERVLDDRLIRGAGHRPVDLPAEILAKSEKDRLTLSPRLRGSKLDEWIETWVKTNLDEKSAKRYFGFFRDRFRKGKLAPSLDELNRLATHEDKSFANEDAFVAWMKEQDFSEALAKEALRHVTRDKPKAYEVVKCLDAESGTELWEFREDAKPVDRRSSGTPAVVDGKVYAVLGRVIRALDAKTGKLLWTHAMNFEGGVASSPLVADGKVVFYDGSLTALDAETGEFAWKQEKAKGREASVMIWKNLLLSHGSGELTGVRLSDGELLWQAPGGGQATPAVEGDAVAVVSSKEKAILAYDLFADKEPALRWKVKWEAKRYAASPIAHAGHLYLLGGGRHLCLSMKDGSLRWSEQVNCELATPILAEDVLLSLERNGGYLSMLRADPGEYARLGMARVQVMRCPTPALANGRLYLRKKDRVACFDLRRR